MSLVNFDGVTCIIKSEPFITSSYDVLHSIPSGNTTFGKNLHLFSLFIMSLSSSENDQILTLLPYFAKCIAKATPQLPLPIISIFFIFINKC